LVVHTEKSLVGRAEELRKELEATVQDVAGLFAKIGRASRVGFGECGERGGCEVEWGMSGGFVDGMGCAMELKLVGMQ